MNTNTSRQYINSLVAGDTFKMHADKRSTPMLVTRVRVGESMTTVEAVHVGTDIGTVMVKPSLSTVDVF